MDQLPGDVLADVLGRLPPRNLAAYRSICKAWHAVIDGHRLLRKDLLPLTVAGIYAVYDNVSAKHSPPTFFSRPSAGARIQGNLRYLDKIRPGIGWSRIGVHCNGLILLSEGVVNPATRQWAFLPPYPDRTRVKGFGQFAFLAFDPTVSPHFEVFFMHCVIHRYGGENTDLYPGSPGSEWPPSPFVMSAFSSKTWRWEERSFAREGAAVRSVADVEPFLQSVYGHESVYWQGRLYVDQIYFVIRLSLEDNKYRVIHLPPINTAYPQIDPYLGKSEKGVYYGFEHHGCDLQIWFLNESTHDPEWTLKHEIDLRPTLASFSWKHGDGSWSVQQDVNHKALEKEELEWDSDNEDGTVATAAATEVNVLKGFDDYIFILGFHPYKEIVFLYTWSKRVMAYHLNSSKLEELGCLPSGEDDEMRSSCIYTPCWMESCLRTNGLETNINH
ncbi:hypothetical protein QYE76_015915 [Lolium multiflorum]|uniref:F-box domain-containing protein n=1 Tax=Lolium multiflorum TaxID=4521 RepID=A0AAD8U7A3_LOLMU|nr:hypothetical protein QYE76_015915 [Lolium multiflorum]